MKLRSCIHLDECSSKLPSNLSLDLLFTVHWLCKFLSSFSVKAIFSETMRTRAKKKLGSCKHLDECSSKLPSILCAYLFFNGSLTSQIFVEFLCLGHFLGDYKG